MMKIGMLEAARPGRVRRISIGVRTFALLVLGCSAASAAALVYPAKMPNADVMRVAPRPDTAQTGAAPVSTKVETRSASPAAASASPGSVVAAPGRASVRQIPLIAGVDPTPPAPSKISAPSQVASAASSAGAPSQATHTAPTAIAASAKAPIDCLPDGLRAVLQDVQTRFGTVTLVSTHELHTDNHSPGSARHKLHSNCRAVDFKVEGDLAAVTAYLRTRPEVMGVNSYKNNRVIHIDGVGSRKLAHR